MFENSQNLLDSMLDRQRHAWLAGAPVRVEDLLEGSSLHNDSDAQLDLIYNEIVVREEIGESPSIDEYARRFPELRDELAMHFEVHRAIGNPEMIQTARIGEADTLPEVAAASDLWPELADYELLHILGQGGMGVVYKARELKLNRVVALKMIISGKYSSTEELSRFRTETQAVAQLHHPNIVQIFEVGQVHNLPFLALELVEFGTLADRLKQYFFAPRPAAELIETLARALHHAHGHNVVHRDLKPANVLYAQDGTPKITDFGLAKVLQDEFESPRDATRTGEPIGTPRYMSPEQATGRHDSYGPALDVYALGTVLYECLTGQVPFVATNVVDTLARIRSEDPVSPRTLQPAVPKNLATICLHCLQKDPARRYASAGALADDLRRFLNGEPIAAQPTPLWERAAKWCRRKPTHAALIGVVVLLLVTGLAARQMWIRREENRVNQLREEVVTLVQEGQNALLRKEETLAEKHFHAAWIKVQGEPELREFQTGVAGWLDHSRRAANLQHWKQRIPPREYDAHRDEAMLLSVLPGDPKESIAVARDAIRSALDLTLPDDPAWLGEREQLIVLDADMIRLQSGIDKALARLNEQPSSSRLIHLKRAEYLEELGRTGEAEVERSRAAAIPPDSTAERLRSGVERLRRRDFISAEKEFDAVLDAEPEHFQARLFQAICFLELNRPAEAKVALTACTAQRPRFAWSYLYRGLCHRALGDTAAAIRDFERGLDTGPSDPARFSLECQIGWAAIQLTMSRIPVMSLVAGGMPYFPTTRMSPQPPTASPAAKGGAK